MILLHKLYSLMKKLWLIILILLVSVNSFAQYILTSPEQTENKTTKEDNPLITAYKIISVKGDTTFVDTTLNIKKDYKFNYLRKDNFGLLMFNNIGQSYTKLTKSFKKLNPLPDFGARAAHFAFLDVEDIFYYNVLHPGLNCFLKPLLNKDNCWMLLLLPM